MGSHIMSRALSLLTVALASASAEFAPLNFGPGGIHPAHALASPVQHAMFSPGYFNHGVGASYMPLGYGLPLGDAKAQIAYQQQFAAMVEQQKKGVAEWETAQKAELEKAQKTGMANPLGFGPYGMGFGFGGLPAGGGAYGLGLAGVNATMPWAPAYPVINGHYRPSFPVPGVPSQYGSPGCGFGQNYLGCVHPNGGAAFMHNFGVWPHPNLAVHGKYNPMGYFPPHPESFNVGAADAMNKYLGVPLFKGPTGQGLPWVPEPKVKAA